MRFTNATPFPALLHRQGIPGRRIAAAIVARATFEIGAPCRASRQQPWRVSPTAWDGPGGLMEPDAVFDRHGCDLFLLGDASSPDGSPVTALDVSMEVGTFSAGVRVLGDRIWVRDGDRLVPGPAEPFVRMPLGPERAYGGVALFDELPIPHPDNPGGKGFHVEMEQAEGGALPNVEDPEHVVTSWEDRPEPVGVGFCSLGFGPRVRRGAVVQDGAVVGVTPALYNAAFPRFVAPAVEPGATVVVRGMGPELRFDLPSVPLVARTRVGGTEHDDPLRIDQVGVEPEKRRLFVTYRYTFIYPLRRGEVRRCELSWQAPPGEALPAPARATMASSATGAL